MDVLEKIQSLADEAGYKLDVNKEADGSLIDTTLEKDGISIDVIIPKHDSGSWAYGIDSYGLPREMYPDSVSKDFTEQRRSEEILRTVEDLTKKRIKFHPKPSFFRKNGGYIELPIDGVTRKIRQRSNYFGLPLA